MRKCSGGISCCLFSYSLCVVLSQLVLCLASEGGFGCIGSIRNTTTESGLARPRQLRGSSGDFEDLNRLLEGAVIHLPDTQVSSDIVSVNLRNIRCTDFAVQQVAVESEKVQRSAHDTFETTNVKLSIEGLDMACFLDWTYTFIFTRQGSADLYSFGNSALFTVDFRRQITLDPPDTSSAIRQCLPIVNINDLEFQGDIAAIIFDTVERLMRNKVELEAEERICKELDSLSKTLVGDILEKVDETLQYYYNIDMDPLKSEKAMYVPNEVHLMDLGDHSKATSKWLDKILAYFVEFATTANAAGNMRINTFLRDSFLQQGALFFNTSLELFNDHNRFINTKVVVDRVKVLGLDNITSFDPFNEIGQFTLQNKVTWNLISIEMDISIDISASSTEDSIFESSASEGTPTREKIKLLFGVKNVSLLLSVLLAVDERKLGAIRLGSLLNSERLIDCLLSAVHDVHVSGLSLQVGDVEPPVMEGFVARGIDRVVSDLVDAAFLIYESPFLEAAPGFFNTVTRRFVNGVLAKHMKVDVSCFIPQRIGGSADGFTDFRDLLLPPEEAFAAGGTGTEPYGDLVHLLVSEVKDHFLFNGEDGLPLVNKYIATALERVSTATDATINLGDILDWNATVTLAGLEADIRVQLRGAKIGNLDSFGSPLRVLDPVVREAHLLNNSISIGVGAKPVRFEATVHVTATDYDGLRLNNEVIVRLDIGNARLMALLFLRVLEDPLFSVPIEDTLNLNCWLSTLFPDTNGVDLSILVQQQFSVDQLLLNISCVSCSSPKFSDLIYGLYSPDEIGNATTKILNIISLLKKSEFFRVTTDTILNGAAKQCPHNVNYDPSFSYSSLLVNSGGDGFGAHMTIRDEKMVYFNVVSAFISGIIIFIFLGARAIARHRYMTWKTTLTEDARRRLFKRERAEKRREAILDSTTTSLFRSSKIPRQVRFMVPLALICTIGVQLIGHTAILCFLDIEGQIAGESFIVHEFIIFRFVEASLRSYRNGGNEMAILLFVFTGIWPYFKLLSCLILWFVPPKTVSVSSRGTFLTWLNVFAKLSMVDIIATLLAVAAFLVFIGGASGRELETGQFFATRLIVVPCAGFYCIVISQRLTRISSNYLLNWHHQLTASTDAIQLDQKQEGVSLQTLATAEESNYYSTVSSLHCPEQFSDDEVETNGCVANLERESPMWTRRNGVWVRHGQSLGLTDKSDDDVIEAVTPVDTEHTTEYDKESLIKLLEKWQWYRLALGMTGLTVFILAVIGMVLAPSIAIDADILWGLFESGKTFAEAVSDYPFFRILCSILVQARLVLDSTTAKAGLGILLALAVVASTAFPLLRCIEFFGRKYQENKLDNRQRKCQANTLFSHPKDIPFWISRRLEALLVQVKRTPHIARRGWAWCQGESYCQVDGSDLDLLPAYQMKAWKYIDVYIFALLIAIWQLGAVAAYVIHQYCTILESSFEALVFLGLVEDTSAQCFREQASSPNTILAMISALLVLMLSFLAEAVGHFRHTVAKARASIKEDHLGSSGK